MHARIFRLLLCVVVFLTTGHDCHQWSSHFAPGTVKYVCSGDTAMLPWTVALNSGESIHDIQWHFQSPSSSNAETIAFYASGLFIPGPGYAQRVSFIPNAGIMLNGLTTADAGTYTVEVTGRNATQMWSLNHQGSLQVIDNSVVSGSQLQVVQQPTAVYDNSTGEWMADLTCGDFSFPTQPPFDVQWRTPSGSSKPSSHYENGKFHLLLPTAEASGNYSCEFSQFSACSQGNSSGSSVASLLVDNTKARLSVLEAAVQDNKAASSQLDHLTQENLLLQQMQQNITEENKKLNEEKRNLTQQNAQTTQDNSKLFQRLQTLESNFNQLSGVVLGASSSNASMTCCDLNQTVNDLQENMVKEIFKLANDINQQGHQVQNNDQLCATLSQQAAGLTSQMNQTHQQMEDLKHDMLFMQQYLLNSPQNASGASGNVHFHVMNNDNDNNHAQPDEVLSLSEVVDNEGSGYNAATGVFTAPVAGTYFFVASTELHVRCHPHCPARGGFKLMAGTKNVDQTELWNGEGGAASGTQMGTVHGAVHLNQGATVWLQNFDHNTDYRPGATSFSGFLISKD